MNPVLLIVMILMAYRRIAQKDFMPSWLGGGSKRWRTVDHKEPEDYRRFARRCMMLSTET